jgi:hypothetical protein
MTLIQSPVGSPPRAVRRVGYLLAGVINLGILYAINVTPGWEALPFLTSDTELVLPLVNLSLAVGVLANLAYAARDPAWAKALGNLITGLVGVAAMARIWTVFPFDFDAYSFNWGLLTRFVLFVAIVGSLIGIIVACVGLVRAQVGDGIRRPE